MRLKKQLDVNGSLSFKGKLDQSLLNEFLNDEYFKKNYPKSLDRGYFIPFLKKIEKLSIEDGLHTLSMISKANPYS